MRIYLPVTTDAENKNKQTKQVLFKCCATWENDRFPSQRPSPPSGMEKSPTVLSKAKQKQVFRVPALF